MAQKMVGMRTWEFAAYGEMVTVGSFKKEVIGFTELVKAKVDQFG